MGKYNDFANDHAVVSMTTIVTANSPALDCKGMEQLACIVQAGVSVSGTLDVVIEDSADGSTGWATVAGAVFTQLTATDAGAYGTIKLNSGTTKRYVRAAITIGGTSYMANVTLIAKNLSGHLPLTVGALPAPDFQVSEPT
jgi:hypothetical protein